MRFAAVLLIGLSLVVDLRAEESKQTSLERAPSRFAKLADTKIHYKTFGQGPVAVVLIHGWTCDSTFFADQVAALAGKYPLVVLDLPGHGLSDKPKVEYTMDYFADAVDAVLKDAKVPAAVFVGHSMGTPVMRQFYRRFPQRTKALVAVEGSLKPDDMTPEEAEKFVATFRKDDYRKTLGAAVDGMFVEATTPQLRARIKNTMLAAPQHVVASAMKGMLDPAIWKPDPIRVPLLSINAKAKWWPADYEAYVRKLAPNVEHHDMPGVGHFLLMEKPAEFDKILEPFLRKHVGTAAMP